LLPDLERIDIEARSQAEFENDGRARYAREFGHPISGSGYRKLFKRTVDRDAGRRQWHRLELFLDDYAAPAPSAPSAPVAFDHSALIARAAFADPAHPSPAERQNLFEYCFLHFKHLAARHAGQRAALKRSIIATLFAAAPALSTCQAALGRHWNRKYKQWQDGGEKPSALNRRAARKAGIHLAQLQPDLDLIVSEAWHHDGKIALAIRKLRREGRLSQMFIDRYTLDVRRRKSYVAKTVRAEINRRLTGTLEARRSQWQTDMAGPRIARRHDHDTGDYFAADDVSGNTLFWFLDDHGRPLLTTGECLIWYDCRSLYPLGYVLTPGHYNGETIRRGILNIHDKHGLPHRAMIFERGIWESRLVCSNRPRDFLNWSEYEMGLRERGLAMELRHAHTPQGKLIEGCFNILQQAQRALPGFAGFNQRDYAQEELQRKKDQVRRGLLDPAGHFYSLEQWRAVLDRSLEEYMHEPQNGKLLQGKSPAEMFAEHRPLRKLDDASRFLLASHRVRATVKANGLAITLRGQRRFYYNQELGAWRGRQVFAWYNVEQPDLLTVTDLDMKNPISVRRQELSAFDASPDQLAEASRQRRGFMKSARLEVDRIKRPVRNAIQRDHVLDSDAQALGSHIHRASAQFDSEQKEHSRLEARARRDAEELGINLPERLRRPEEKITGAQLWRECGEEIAREEMEGASLPAPAKTYLLDTPAQPPSPAAYWSLSGKLEKTLGLSAWSTLRHQLTAKHLGGHPRVNDMTGPQLAKMLDVFAALLRQHQPALE
jgi:hypothetical protein